MKLPALPSDAVVSFDDKHYIFTFDRNKDENGDEFTEYRIIEVRKGMTSWRIYRNYCSGKF